MVADGPAASPYVETHTSPHPTNGRELAVASLVSPWMYMKELDAGGLEGMIHPGEIVVDQAGARSISFSWTTAVHITWAVSKTLAGVGG